MNDLKVFKDMLKKANIEYKLDHTQEGSSITVEGGGYIGFVSIISFNGEGMLKTIEAYE